MRTSSPAPCTSPGRREPARSACVAVLAGVLALAGLGCSSASRSAEGTGATGVIAEERAKAKAMASVAPRTARTEAPFDGPVTHAGRTVFPRCHRMTIAKVLSRTPPVVGSEIVRLEEIEVLWGPADDSGEPLQVVAGSLSLVPENGRTALVLLRLLPTGSYEVIEAARTDDTLGPMRVAAFRSILAIEAIPEPAARHAALRSFLRTSAASEDPFARDFAVREYAAYSAAFPGRLEKADHAAIEGLRRTATRDPELKRLLATIRRPDAADSDPLLRGAGKKQ